MRYIIREKLLAFGNDSIINNEKGQPVFDVDGKALSVLNTLVVRDIEKNKVVTIKQNFHLLVQRMKSRVKDRNWLRLARS